MDKQFQSQTRAPLIIAIVLLLLPVLYVSSYLALVVPEGVGLVQMQTAPDKFLAEGTLEPYRIGSRFSEVIFWPIEQMDRRIRVGDWALGDLLREI